jgi:hypothetical protein
VLLHGVGVVGLVAFRALGGVRENRKCWNSSSASCTRDRSAQAAPPSGPVVDKALRAGVSCGPGAP